MKDKLLLLCLSPVILLAVIFQLILINGGLMNTSTILKAVGIVLVCTAIHFGLSLLLSQIIFGAGLGFMFLF